MFARFLFVILMFAAPLAAADDATILVVGDSLSAGFGIGREQSWPALLEFRLKQEALPYDVVNASISGETTAGGLSRLPGALREFKPAVVIIELGANDGLRGLPVSALRQNLDAMVTAARRAGARVVLVGMRLPPNYGPDYTAGFNDSFADIARRRNVALVPFLLAGFADQPEAFQADGLHPTAAWQPAMLGNIWPVLAPLLRKR